MILAVPMVVITRIVCDHLDHPYAKTLMRLLEGNVFEVRCCWLGLIRRLFFSLHAVFFPCHDTVFVEEMHPSSA